MNKLYSVFSKALMRISFFAFLFIGTSLFSQVGGYTFTTATGASLNAMAGSTSIVSSGSDDVASAVTNIGFTFTFGCTNYTQFSASSNGLMGLGAVAVASGYSNATTGASYPIIMPMWDDMHTGTNGKVHYLLSGSSPNRTLTVEWLFNNFSESGSAYTKTIQVRLIETSNVVEIVYGNNTGAAIGSASVGIASASSSYVSVTTSAHTASNSSANDANTSWPGSGRKYTFTPGGSMAYSSSTVTQASTATLTRCDVAQAITCIQVVTTGSCTPISLTQLKIQMSGTAPTSDVSLIHIYYTGTSSTYSATGAFDGVGTAVAAGTITINGSQALATGTNYFWVAYDMNPAATIGNTVDGLCLASPTTTLTVGGVARTVTANDPAGSRTIAMCPGSPGGISSGLTLWLKAASGVTTSGVNVTGWTDQSTAALAVTVVGSPDLTAASSAYNYNPYVNFTLSSATGGDFLRIPATNIRSFFWVAKLNTLSRKSTHLATYDGVTLSAPCALCPIHGGENGGAVAQYHEASYGSGNFQAAGVWRKNGDASISYNQAHSGNFDIVTALGGSAVPTNVFMGGQNDNLPSFDGRTRDWVGPVAEIISYTGAITTAQANRIESYLAVKYGITLGGNASTTTAYTSTTAATIWNSNTGYHYDVMGIGKDATESLDQPKSHSINTPADLITIANSNFATPTSLTNDGDYLMVGHNNGSLATPTFGNYTHGGPSTAIGFQTTRVWRTQKTGTPSGNVIIEVDMALVNGPTGYGTNANADIRLLVDNDATFSNASAGEHTYSPTAGYSTTGGKIYFTVPYSDIQIGTGFFTIGSVNVLTAPLPVELTSFTATCEQALVNLKWSTATETNNDYFTIDRAGDNMLFETIAEVQGSGSSSMQHNYEWNDLMPLSGNSYYRLKQTDYDGRSETFNTIQTICIDETMGQLEITNSFTQGDELVINFTSSEAGWHSVKVFDLMGNVVFQEEKYVSEKSDTDRFDYRQLANGMYVVNIQNTKKSVYRKVLLNK